MNLGFTGTQEGMSKDQKTAFIQLIYKLENIKRYHHGNCIGSDCESVAIINSKLPDVKIYAHPSNIKNKQCSFDRGFFYPAKPPLIRNHDIVDAIEKLIATPKEQSEIVRSGTWATIRYARKKKREVYIIYPDGTIRRN